MSQDSPKPPVGDGEIHIRTTEHHYVIEEFNDDGSLYREFKADRDPMLLPKFIRWYGEFRIDRQRTWAEAQAEIRWNTK